MTLKLNQSVFGTEVMITRSGEAGTVKGFALYERSKSTKMFFVLFTDASGRAQERWFDEDELTVA